MLNQAKWLLLFLLATTSSFGEHSTRGWSEGGWVKSFRPSESFESNLEMIVKRLEIENLSDEDIKDLSRSAEKILNAQEIILKRMLKIKNSPPEEQIDRAKLEALIERYELRTAKALNVLKRIEEYKENRK